MLRARLLVPIAVATLLNQGCSLVIMSSSWGSRPEQLSVASSRENVEAELGRPIGSEAMPDGGRVDTFRFRVYKRGERLEAGDWARGYLIGNAYTLGLLELGLTSYALYKLANQPRNEIRIAFGPDGRVAWVGSPPMYGPADDALEALTTGAIRTRCWSQDQADLAGPTVGDGNHPAAADPYVRCVAHGLAVWGIVE